MITESILRIVYRDAPMRAHPAEYNSTLPLHQLITATMNKFTLLLAALALSLSLNAQTINDNIRNDWPDERYQVHTDGTVTDTVTGLMWMQCSLGQTYVNDTCSDSNDAAHYNWQEALEAAEASTFANHADWRLPNIKELSSLAARDRYSPAINSTVFPNTPSDFYWTASPNASDMYFAWRFYFNTGYDNVGNRGDLYYVRLVRVGQ